MHTREELLEALAHVLDTKTRLAKEPGTHAARAALQPRIDELLDQLNLTTTDNAHAPSL